MQTEMDAWWKRNDLVKLGDYTRAKVEDLTGKTPLLLDSCTVEGVVNFECDEVYDVVRQCR
jgi:hypothetical protein